ncbi:MAG: hypothetical protein ACNA8W_25620, partial [Bradymonadaceae bacterium]
MTTHPKSSEEATAVQWLLQKTLVLKWRLLGLMVACAILVILLPLTETDSETSRALTAQALARAQIVELDEALASLWPNEDEPRTVEFFYEGPQGTREAVWGEISRVADLHMAPPIKGSSLPRLTASVTTIPPNVLHLTIRLDGPESDRPMIAEGSRRIGDWQAILPPLMAILMALFLRQIIVAMAGGVWLGAIVVAGHSPVEGTTKALSYFASNVTDSFNLYIIGFTFGLVGMVHVMIRMGGMAGILELLAKFATSARSTRIATALMGLAIFFDDYANTIVVGTTMRP